MIGVHWSNTIDKELTHIDLFSGIGGFTLAAEWAGFKTVAFCEKEKFCQKVLKKRFGAIIANAKSSGRATWPSKGQPRRCDSIPLVPEIRDFDGTKYRGATLLTGGFPCQPFSDAGKKRGKEDDRYLWPEMLRVIGEAKPRWILAENVPGIFRMALDTVLADLEGEGYTTGTFIIPACGLNAPHRRNRVWIVGYSSSSRGRGATRGFLKGKGAIANGINPTNSYAQNSIRAGTGNQSGKINDQEGRISKDRRKGIRQKDRTIGTSRIATTNNDASNSTSKREKSISQQGQRNGVKSSNSHATDSKKRDSRKQETRDGWKSFERGDWEKNWHEVAARFCRVDDGVSDRIHRLKALGNAIVPQIAYEILKNIAWIENELA